MTERPILFSSAMVLALRANRKTQTRRTNGLAKINAAPDAWELRGFDESDGLWVWDSRNSLDMYMVGCPFGLPGDRLWTRESMIRPDGDPWLYAADKMPVMVDAADETAMVVWAHHKEQDHCPSIHMPRWASRDTLEVISVRPERLQAITEADAIAEGCEPSGVTAADVADFQMSDSHPELKAFSKALGVGSFTAKFDYMVLWGEINGPGSWAKNSWVWRVEFRRLTV